MLERTYVRMYVCVSLYVRMHVCIYVCMLEALMRLCMYVRM